MRIAIELIEGLRYKLRVFGVPIDGPCNVLCDNESVVKNVKRPEVHARKSTTQLHIIKQGSQLHQG